jgi:hypothetical protein
MRALASLEAGEWVLYEWQESERIGRIAETGDPLTILHPGATPTSPRRSGPIG